MDTTISSVGKHIRHVRKQRHLSQEKLAELVGMSRISISGIETGKKIPSVESLVSIASALHVSPDDLLFSKDDLLSQIMHFYKNCSPKEQKLLFTLSKETLSILHNQNIFLDDQ